MDDKFNQAFNQASAFQKMWTDSFLQMADVWSSSSPGKPPPESIREMRAGMLKVLTESWDEFMRSPQFMEGIKTSMDGILSARKMAAEAMTRGHHEAQAPAREDINGILLAIRHMERRLLDRIEEVETGVMAVGKRIDSLETKSGAAGKPKAPRKTAPRKTATRKAASRSKK